MGSTRKQRFPSVDERVQIYMGNWYTPPCSNITKAAIYFEQNGSKSLKVKSESTRNETIEIFSEVEADRILFLDIDALHECAKISNVPNISSGEQENKKLFKLKKKALILKNMRLYCLDALTSLMPAYLQLEAELSGANKQFPPLVVQFGDLQHSHSYGFLSIPHFKKFRNAATRAEINDAVSRECLTERPNPLRRSLEIMQPIVWKLSVSRHYNPLSLVEYSDTPWDRKKPMAVFRGQLTGSLEGYTRHASDEANCFKWRRCRLVLNHSNSTLIDAKLTSTRKRISSTINGISLVGSPMSIQAMLKYKAIIMLEGNDVASGLKWALLSQSVVLMPPPKFTSWAMEERLVPWVHYIPLKEDASDVEEMMQWVVDHDYAAQQISERGSLWIEDLCFHPDAVLDDRLIQEEIVRRYAAHFRPAKIRC
ncbi:hypothetical protein ACA910_002747 [Epithemia clementina (nom. ined.)]